MKKYKGIFFIAAAASFWGSCGVFVHSLAETGLSEMGIVFGRSAFSVVILGAYLLVFDRKAFAVKLRDLWLFALTGIASIAFFNFCYFSAMGAVGISTAAILLYTAPVFVMLISVLFLGERLSFIKIICCLLAVVGCALVSGFSGGASSINVRGLLLGLGAAFGYSLYGIFSSILLKKGYSAMTITFYSFAFSVVGCAAVLGSGLQSFCAVVFSDHKPLLLMIFMALINTIAPYLLYSQGLKTVRPTVAIIVATVEPVVATVFDITVYKKFPSILTYTGIVLVLSSVLVLNLFGKGEKATNETACKRQNKSDA